MLFILLLHLHSMGYIHGGSWHGRQQTGSQNTVQYRMSLELYVCVSQIQDIVIVYAIMFEMFILNNNMYTIKRCPKPCVVFLLKIDISVLEA